MKIKELDRLVQDKKSLTITLAASLLYILPLLLADYEYLDDYARNLFGYGWQHDGRFIATLLGKIVSLNSANLSIYPFSLVLSALILGFTGYIFVTMAGIEENKTIKWSSLLVITAPAFLGNLVYKFDCLPMSLSIFFVVIPYIFYESRLKFALASSLGIFLSLGLYQSGTTIFFMVGSLFLIQELLKNEWKNFFYNSLIIAASFVVSFICYKLVIKIAHLEMYGRADMIFGESNFLELLSYSNGRFLERLDLILRSGNYKKYVLFSMFFTVIGMIILIYTAKDKLKKLFTLPMVLLIIAVNFWLISGVNMLLLKCNWDLRSYCGLGFFIIICVYFHKYIQGRFFENLSRFSVAILVFFSFVLMAQFGKVLTLQTQFQNDFIADTKQYISDKQLKNIKIAGTLTIAPKNYFSYSQFPIFENLVGSPLGQHSSWNKEVLNINAILNDVKIEGTRDWICKGTVVKESKFYIIRRIDNETIVLDFERNKCDE